MQLSTQALQTDSIAVVIPAYNAEGSIVAALNSVLGQTMRASEIIVVDDGSSDNTAAIAAAFGDPVRVISQANGGPSMARNRGALQSRASYIAFLDADDSWHPSKLARQLRLLRSTPRAVLCYTGLLEQHPDGRRIRKMAEDPETLDAALLIGNPGISPSCVMIRSSSFHDSGGFSLSYKGCEDWELWVRLHKIGPFCAVTEPLTNYQMSVTGLSANADRLYEDFMRLLDTTLLTRFSGLQRFIWRRRIMSYQSYRAALTARSASEHEKELRYMLLSLCLWPSPFWQPRRSIALIFTLRQFVLGRGTRERVRPAPTR